jgi:uncharacterized protein
MQEVRIPSASGDLAGTLFSANASGRHPAVLVIHGWTSAQDRHFDMAEMVCERAGATTLTFDLRGHGKTIGDINTLSRKNFLVDVVAAYDFLLSQEGVDPNNVGVIGSSFGGYLAALLTSKRKIAWAVLRVPADYPDEGFDQSKKMSEQSGKDEWRKQCRDWDATAALCATHAFQGRVLIVESEKDDLIPRQTLLNYKDAVSDARNVEYVVMKNAPHSLSRFPEMKKEFNEIVFTWLKNK